MNNESFSLFPSQFDEAVGDNFNALGQPQTLNFYWESVLKFHWNLEYNAFGVETQRQVIIDNI
jgi:hypothetical protein